MNYTKTKSKWVSDINAKYNFKKDIGNDLDIQLGNIFLDLAPKTWSKKEKVINRSYQNYCSVKAHMKRIKS